MVQDNAPSERLKSLGLQKGDKTAIVVALREVARAIEHNHPNSLNLMQAIGTELVVLALKNGPLLDEITNDEEMSEELRDKRKNYLEGMIRAEVAAIVDSIARFHEHKIAEVDILNERLTRMFDPAMAWNEAINRAIAAKKKAGLAIRVMTSQQKVAFETFQLPSTMMALKNAGRENPEPMVRRIGNAEFNKIAAATGLPPIKDIKAPEEEL